MNNDAPFSVYYALDGPHLDGLIGSAGILRFDWPERKFYVKHFDGISAAHNPSIAPNGKLVLLGNFSQTIFIVDITDPNNMREAARQSTMFFEESRYRLRANTHHLWYPDSERFIGAVGDHLYRFRVGDLKNPENLGPHYLENAHELRWDPTNRYILMGDLGPEKKDVRQVGVFDLEEPVPEKRCRIVGVQNNVWHCRVHPHKPIGYALTYSLITDHDDWVNWSPGFVREYIYEIDLTTAKITRTWSSAAEFPAHLNSDIEISQDEILYIASGGSHAVVEIPLERFAESRVLPCIPRWTTRAFSVRDKLHTLLGAVSRKATAGATHYMIQTLEVTGNRILDGIYATRVSPDGKYIITGNRGYNTIAVYDRKTFKKVYEKLLPFRRDVYRNGTNHYRLTNRFMGYHLGVHHSELIARDT